MLQWVRGVVAWFRWRHRCERHTNTFASVHWYCTKCEENSLEGKSSSVWKALNQMYQRQKKDNETHKQETQLIELMKKHLLTINFKVDNPKQAASYATVARKHRSTLESIQQKFIM